MAQTSAALALVRGDGDTREILLVHPGGPFWSKKDDGAWSLPKGLVDPAEDVLEAAKREFLEEVGSAAPEGPYVDLGAARLKSGKTVRAFAARGDLDANAIRSNEIEIDWPPRSGKKLRIPEVDRAGWFDLAGARKKISEGQAKLVEAAFGASFP
jgi:predicted NUDIX family NTP pyrophosphohydrolase